MIGGTSSLALTYGSESSAHGLVQSPRRKGCRGSSAVSAGPFANHGSSWPFVRAAWLPISPKMATNPPLGYQIRYQTGLKVPPEQGVISRNFTEFAGTRNSCFGS
jgi:hypothetical protein